MSEYVRMVGPGLCSQELLLAVVKLTTWGQLGVSMVYVGIFWHGQIMWEWLGMFKGCLRCD